MEKRVSGKRYIWRLSLALVVLAICCAAVYGISADAKEPINTDRFESAGGVIHYLAKSANYYIDMEEGGLLDVFYTSLQALANMLWGTLRLWGVITTVLFYFCMDFNLTELLDGGINALQSSFMGNIFAPLFSLGFCGAVIVVLKNMLRRDTMGILAQFGKVVGVWVLSMLLVNHTETILNSATDITKSISCQILVSMGGGSVDGTEPYALQMADVIWNATVHQPWVYIEFMGTNADEGTIDAFLDLPPMHPVREQMVQDDTSGAFSMANMVGKIAFLLAYSIPFVVKCLIYIALSVIMLSYQFFAVFYVLLAPIMLILMMFPGYERVISIWIRKLIETQVGILLLTMILGLLLKVDDLLYTRMVVSWGWLVVVNVQSGLELIVLIKRKDITAGLNQLQKSISNPRYATKMIRDGSTNSMGSMAGSAIQTVAMIRTVSKIAGAATGGAGMALGTVAGKAVEGAAAGQAASYAAAAGSAAMANGAAFSVRPRMSDCPATYAKSRMERISPGSVQGSSSRTIRASRGTGSPAVKGSAAMTSRPQGTRPAAAPERPKTSQIGARPINTPLAGNNDSKRPLESSEGQSQKAGSTSSAPTVEHPKLQMSGPEKFKQEPQKKHQQVQSPQRREAVHTSQTYIPRGDVSSRLQRDHTKQMAQIERPSSSVKQ